MKSRLFPALVLVTSLAVAAPSLAEDGRGHVIPPATNPTSVVKWNEVLLQCIRIQKLGPPMVARGIGLVYTAGFDAWACYDDVAVPTTAMADFRRPASERTLANREKAYSYAVARTMADLFPAGRDMIRAQMLALGYDPDDQSRSLASAQGVGNTCSKVLLDDRHHDGSNQLGDLHAGAYTDYTNYRAVNTLDQIVDPNRWQPLRFSNGAGGFVAPGFMAPQWGNVRPFAMPTGDALRPAVGPARFPSREYERQARDVMQLNEQLDDRGKVIAEYWADGPKSETPPGHWTLFAELISARDHHTFDDDAKMFFLLGNSVMDASIAVWEAKVHYDSERPITAVRYLFAGQKVRAYVPFQGRTMVNGETWMPYQPATFVTPPFAEFPSGHSAFSAASAEILKRFSGSDDFDHSVTIAAGSSKVEPGFAPSRPVTLRWRTFSDAADEAGISRRLGGIHFEDADLASRRLGRQVAALVWTKGMQHIMGSDAPIADDDDDRHAARPASEGLDASLRVTVGPTPTAGRITMDFAVSRDEHVRASVVDLQGREIAVIADAPFASGAHSITWDGSRQAPGMYFVQVRRGTTTTTHRVLIAR